MVVTPSDTSMATHGERGERNKLGLFTLGGLCIVLCQVSCEVGKQISNYGIQVYNGGQYPIPQTLLVVFIELLKLLFTIIRSGFQTPPMDFLTIKQSFKFLLPSLLYAVNNNLYLFGLTLVPPPIWIILGSFRTVVTASIYKFVLGRPVSISQFVGAFLIVTSIVVAKLGSLHSTQTNSIPLSAILLAAVAATNSVGAAVYTESLFKNSSENFLEQQFWLYLYGSAVSFCVHWLSNPVLSLSSIGTLSGGMIIMLSFSLMCGSVGGLVVAAILKKLDNIVKEYSGATANMVTALLCSYMFPDKFQFTIFIFMAMVLLFSGIFLYETGKVNEQKPEKINGAKTET